MPEAMDVSLPEPMPSKPVATKARGPRWHRRKAVRIAVVVALLLGAASHFVGKRRSKNQTWSDEQAPPVTAPVAAAAFVQEVVERGEVESSSNIEVRCEVQGRGSLGTAIIEIVPEGTYVKAGDFIVKLDDSTLQADLVQQQIACNSSRALVVEAQADVESARLALEEYESGTFLQEEQAKESDEFVAKENMRRAEEYLRYSERLAARGYVTEVQLEADRFAVEKARKELESAQTKLEVLHRFTKQKSLNKLKADVETTEARLASRQNSHNLDDDKLKLIETQVAKCVLIAPTSGQVVYANETTRNASTGEPLIAEGKLVRERQLIVRLPDPKRMRVIARINESRIDRVKEDMRVKIKVDAFPGVWLEGTVRDVSEYPMASLVPYSMMKEYAAQIEIHDPPEGLRAGMTAQAAIQVHNVESAVQVPLQAVIQRDDRFFCLLTIDNERIEAREVTVGLSNDKSVIIEDGVFPGQQVVLAPQNYEDLISLPAATGKPRSKPIAKAKSAAKAAKSGVVAAKKAPVVAVKDK